MRSFKLMAKADAAQESLLRQLDPARLPRHVAIIMDGNGRWAAQRGLPRVAGHRAGAAAVRRTVETAARAGVECLTLFAFSTENWKRPRLEVEALMKLLREFISKELNNLKANRIRFRMIGRSEGMDLAVLEEVRRAEQETAQGTGMLLSIAINYGARAEIVDAFRKVAAEVKKGLLEIDGIDERIISDLLYTGSLPDPDLLIRTSGEMRVSNFLLWQIAYSEIVVTERLWPDFDGEDFLSALIDYQGRDRRYGGIKHAQEG